MNITRIAAAVACISLAVSLSACSSTEDAADANEAFCTSVATVQTEVATLKALVATDATVEDVQDQRDAVAKAVADAGDEIEGLADSVKAEVETANEAFADAVDAIPTDVPLSEARAQYNAAVLAWDKAILSIRTEVGCK